MVRHFSVDSDSFTRRVRREKLVEIASKQFGERIVPLETVRFNGKEYFSCFGIRDEKGALNIQVLPDIYLVVVTKQRGYDSADEFANNVQSTTGIEPTLIEIYDKI